MLKATYLTVKSLFPAAGSPQHRLPATHHPMRCGALPADEAENLHGEVLVNVYIAIKITIF